MRWLSLLSTERSLQYSLSVSCHVIGNCIRKQKTWWILRVVATRVRGPGHEPLPWMIRSLVPPRLTNVNPNYIRLHADVQVSVSDWRTEPAARDVWKSITAELGEQSARTTSTILTLVSSAIVLDSGWYWRLQSTIKQNSQNHFQQLTEKVGY